MLLAYRLEGADDKWTVSTGAHQVEYRGLPPGSYTFELRAYGRAQPDTWKDARLSFVVPVVWYRSLWFYIMVLPSLAAVFLLFYMLHLQRIKGRFKLILEERTRLAREMHDTLIQGCNGVAMLLEADASSRGPLASKYLDIAREQLQATVADARKAVWNLRQTQMDPDVIIASLKNISVQASESFGIPVAVSHSAKLPRVSADAAHELLMIVREAVTNAGSHGRPHAVDISAQHVKDHLLLRISDDGIGFNVEAASTPLDDHYGILGMRERAEMIGANLEITSGEDTRTCILISLNVASLKRRLHHLSVLPLHSLATIRCKRNKGRRTANQRLLYRPTEAQHNGFAGPIASLSVASWQTAPPQARASAADAPRTHPGSYREDPDRN